MLEVTTTRRRWLGPLLLAAGMFPSYGRAEGPKTTSGDAKPVDCPTASEDGQRLREQLKYRGARERFRSCAQASCPGLVRKDCMKWGSELDEIMPTVVVGVVDENDRDMTEVELSIDGEMVAARVDGTAVAIDPGKHELRATSSGRVPTSTSLVIRVGEKNRLVHLKFAPKPRPLVGREADVAHAAPPVAAPAPTRHSYAPPVLTLVLGGVGLLGLGSFAALGVTSKSDLGVLRQTCAPTCAPDDLDGIKTRMLLADLSLGVGIVSLGVGAALWVLRANEPLPKSAARSAWQLGAAPLQGGAAGTLAGSF